MRGRALALLSLFALAACAANAPGPSLAYSKLPPGRYSIAVRGMICTVCARAISAEWAKLPEVEKASVDFENESGTVTIRPGRTLKVPALLKALRRAERAANLDAHYQLADIR